jgi:extracellular factor (EF) 3-hydroxypalmitic acid methyl ester biosynthesis protein
MSYVALDIFQQLRQEDIHWMLATSELETISANGILVREDDPSETIFFIADGLFEVYVYGGSAIRLKVGQLGPGEIIGEISWLGGKPISATVRALETSSVVALSIATLERRLAEYPAFAARLFRAVATLTAERLRTTTSQIRRSELAAGQHASVAGSAEAATALSKVDELKRSVAAAEKSADAGAAASVAKAFSAVEQSLGPQGLKEPGRLADGLQSDLLPLIRLSATGERLYAKPRGYAGDYQTIEMIYSDAPTGTGSIGAVLDRSILDLAVAKAIRNRRRLLASEVLKSYAATSKELHVACLACGPASEIFDVFEKAGDKSRLHVSCIDIDREALAQVAARAQEQKLADQLGTFHGNLIYLATGRQELDLAPQDLIYSLNLTDYFSDELVVTLINWIYDELRPGGRAILGNFHPRNPSRGLMDHVLDWRLTYRDEAAMNQLFLASKFAKPCSRIFFEEDGIYLLAECAK